MEQRNDEIDLLELSRNMMVRFYHYVIRSYKLLAIFIFIGGILGVVNYSFSRNIYQNLLVGNTRIISPVYVVQIINSLNDMKKSNPEGFGDLLELKNEQIENLVSIEADTVTALRKSGSIEIAINYKDELDILPLLEKINQYIHNNDYVSREFTLNKRKKTAIIKQLEQEISKLDSLEKSLIRSINQKEKSNTTVAIHNEKGVTFYHKDIIGLETQKQDHLNSLERTSVLDIISGFEKTNIKKNSLIGTTAKFILVFFALGFIISLVLEFKRSVKNIEKTKNTKNEN